MRLEIGQHVVGVRPSRALQREAPRRDTASPSTMTPRARLAVAERVLQRRVELARHDREREREHGARSPAPHNLLAHSSAAGRARAPRARTARRARPPPTSPRRRRARRTRSPPPGRRACSANPTPSCVHGPQSAWIDDVRPAAMYTSAGTSLRYAAEPDGARELQERPEIRVEQLVHVRRVVPVLALERPELPVEQPLHHHAPPCPHDEAGARGVTSIAIDSARGSGELCFIRLFPGQSMSLLVHPRNVVRGVRFARRP